MIRRPPRSTRTMNRRQRQMCIRDRFYCLKGKCEVTINVQKHILEKDDIAFVVMNDTYSLLSNTETMCCIIDIPIHRYLSQKDTQFLISGTKIDESSRDRIKYWILKILELHCLSYNDVSEIQRLIQFLLIELSYLKLSLIHISEPTRHFKRSRMPSSA